jgi:hypothetical protein
MTPVMRIQNSIADFAKPTCATMSPMMLFLMMVLPMLMLECNDCRHRPTAYSTPLLCLKFVDGMNLNI